LNAALPGAKQALRNGANRSGPSGCLRLVDGDGSYRFSQDYIFGSPSAAAAVVFGLTANGWIEWKDKEGKTLHEVKRVTVDQ
jgi:hypothetical protein